MDTVASLISEIDRLLETKEWDSQKVHSLLKQVRSRLLTLEPTAEPSSTVEEIIIAPSQKISKLTDLIDFPRQGWSLAIENSTSKVQLYLLEEATKKAYPLHGRVKSDSLENVLNSLREFSSPKLTQEKLEEVLENIQRVLLCCSTWRHQTVCLQIEEILKVPEIFWLNPPITLLLSHLEKLESIPTLVIWTGEAITEFAIVNLPSQKKLISSCFWRHGAIKYGQESLLQDLFCHLIYPQWESQLSGSLPKLLLSPARVGQADSQTRNILKTQLETHPLGSALLRFTLLLQHILSNQEYYQSQLQGQPWEIKRSDYENQIVSPYLEYLQVSLEDILKITLADIKQVVWGGTLLESLDFSSLPWTKETFPQAKFFTGLDLTSGIATVLDYPALFI